MSPRAGSVCVCVCVHAHTDPSRLRLDSEAVDAAVEQSEGQEAGEQQTEAELHLKRSVRQT